MEAYIQLEYFLKFIKLGKIIVFFKKNINMGFLVLISVLSCLLISSCNIFKPYKIPILQGENFTPDKIKKIQPMMTKDQVLYLLGTPNVNSPFSANTWIYVYTKEQNYLPKAETKLILTFDKDGKLSDISGNGYPPNKLTYQKV